MCDLDAQTSQISHGELTALLQTLPIGVCVFSLELRCRYANAQMAILNDFPLERYQGRFINDVMPQLSNDGLAVLQQVMSAGAPVAGPVLETIVSNSATATMVAGSLKYSYTTTQSQTGELTGLQCLLHQAGDQLADEIQRHQKTEARLQEREQLLNEAQRVGQIGHWAWDFENDSFEASDQFCRIYALPPDMQLNYDIIASFVFAEDRQDAEHVRKDVIARKVGYEYAVRIRRLNGDIRYVAGKATVRKNAQGDVVGLFATTQDVTEQRRATEALQESDDRFQDFADISADYYFETDKDLYYTFFSNSMLAFGKSPKDFVGRRRDEILNHALYVEAEDVELRAMRAHKAYRNIERRSLVDRDEWLRMSGKPILSAEGDFLGYRGTISDITELKIKEAALQQSETNYRRLVEESRQGVIILDGAQIVFAS